MLNSYPCLEDRVGHWLQGMQADPLPAPPGLSPALSLQRDPSQPQPSLSSVPGRSRSSGPCESDAAVLGLWLLETGVTSSPGPRRGLLSTLVVQQAVGGVGASPTRERPTYNKQCPSACQQSVHSRPSPRSLFIRVVPGGCPLATLPQLRVWAAVRTQAE